MGKISFSRKSLGIPYALFLVLFVVAPLFVLIYYAFTNGQGQFTLFLQTRIPWERCATALRFQ